MTKVLVTGASGFIGKHCVNLLKKRNIEIHALTSKNLTEPDVFYHQVNLLDNSQLLKIFQSIKPDYLLHLAWTTEHGKYWSSDTNLDWVQSSIEMIKLFYRFGGRKVVVAGTCAEYDWNYGFCTENITPLNPSSFYGVCKKSLFEILNKFSEQSSLNYSWARIFFVYGPFENNSRLIPYTINSLLSKKNVYCSNPYQIRDFIYVEDAALILTDLIFSDYNGAINIGSGEPYYIKDIVHQISNLLNSSDLIDINPTNFKNEQYPFVVSNTTLLKENLNFTPVYNITEGLSKTIEWWKNNND